jgi:hypothetical protein
MIDFSEFEVSITLILMCDLKYFCNRILTLKPELEMKMDDCEMKVKLECSLFDLGDFH